MAKRPYAEWDTECAVNYWLLKVMYPMGHMKSWTLHPHKPAFYHWELAEIQACMQQFTMVGFNSQNYDEPMIRLALAGVGVHALKEANDAIIVGKLKRWDFNKRYPMAKYRIPYLDTIDIAEVLPGVKISLKTYMARCHSETIQDLPFDPTQPLDEATQAITDEYCGNDLRGTRELRQIIKSRIELREKLTDKLNAELQAKAHIPIQRPVLDTNPGSWTYGLMIMGLELPSIHSVDLRSKSDAQMSEAIIAAKLGYRPEVPYLPTGYQFQLRPAPWLQFVTPQLQEVFEICKRVVFFWSRNDDGEEYIGPDGKKVKTGVNMPLKLKNIRVHLGRSVYKFGIGGLHSMEKRQSVYSRMGVQTLSDHDVGSFYPALAILLGLFGEHIRPIYQEIFNERMAGKGKIKGAADALKAAQECDKAALAQILDEIETLTSGFKIVLNGGYGKLWSKYSFLLDPDAGVAITINGQLSLLMLIERLELGGISVVSANTDGIVLCTPWGLEGYRDSTLAWWEKATGLTTEATFYKSIHSRDVNSYIAVKPDGSVKRKGKYSESGILASMQGVHPDMDISKEAAVAWVQKGTPIAQTVRSCRDIRMFIMAKGVKGGGQHQGCFLGKTVRWYYSKNGEPIRYITNGNKVAGSDGAMPVQRLPKEFPVDIDYEKYEAAAREILAVAGVTDAQ